MDDRAAEISAALEHLGFGLFAELIRSGEIE
jgi:hypothetical protein